jgi:hypothetical protein
MDYFITVSKLIDFLPFGGSCSLKAGNYPSYFCCTRSYVELQRGAREDNINITSTILSIPAPPLLSRGRVGPSRQADRNDDNDNDDVGGIQGLSRRQRCRHCHPRAQSIHCIRDSECSRVWRPPATLQPPRLTCCFVRDGLPQASRSRAAPPVTSATTTSLGGGESRYVNDEDVDKILVSNDPGVFTLIAIDKQGGECGASFARTGRIYNSCRMVMRGR